MGRKANAKREPRAAAASKGFVRATPNWPLLALSLLGCALAGYLSWTTLAGGSVQGCSAGSGCDVVLSEDLTHGRDYGGVRVENPFRK